MKPTNFLCRLFPAWFKPGWKECSRASCWDGSNAQKRMMNMLSPHFSDRKFKDYLKWQKGRGCNTVHLILCNHRDGEGGGYSIYGRQMFGTLDNGWIKLARKRILECRRAGMGVVLWGMTDDDGGWNDTLLKNPAQYGRDLLKTGLLRYASTFVLALEMTEERSSAAAWIQYRDAVKKGFKGRIGVHHNSYRVDFAGIADILFYQIEPGANAARVKSECAKALATGKPVNFFELSRNPARDLCKAAFEAGAFGVGNW